MTKKKALPADRDRLIGLRILQAVVFRHHHLRLLSAACACLLLLSAFVSALITDNLHGHHFHLKSNYGVHVSMKIKEENTFRHPAMKGGSLGIPEGSSSSYSYGCSNASNNFKTAEMKTEANRYLLVATSGGLNQQRTGITDAVVAAYILNATLVVPELDQQSFWQDSSNFSDIFDVDWFIAYLSEDVKIIRELPEDAAGAVITTQVPRKCNIRCYQTRILPLFQKNMAVRLRKFDYRLSDWLDEDLQKLRCRVNYHALRFTRPILEMGSKLVERMRMKTSHFVALHLRYEADMLAFSGCYYGGGERETVELGSLRKRWKNLHTMDPDRERRHGNCPLSPEEVGVMLRAMGFGKEAPLYVASGEIYGGEETLGPLKAHFPIIHTKETLATEEELAEFTSYSSRMAALDFIVCDQSDVFVSNNNGNMAKILSGKRRYFGHRPTIRPNTKKLAKLFLNRENITEDVFSSRVRKFQIGFMGKPDEVKVGRVSFHEYPSSCICRYNLSNNDVYRRHG